MSTVKFNNLQNLSGGIPTVKGQQLIPTAWCSFNGSTNAIGDSENISSITDYGAGSYGVNFTTAMATWGYAPVGSAETGSADMSIEVQATSLSYVRIWKNVGASLRDAANVHLVVMGGQ